MVVPAGHLERRARPAIGGGEEHVSDRLTGEPRKPVVIADNAFMPTCLPEQGNMGGHDHNGTRILQLLDQSRS